MQHPRTYAIYAYLAAGGATLGGLALASALLGDREGRVWWPLSRIGSAGMLRACGVHALRVEGAERLTACRPAVVMVNHESLFDPAVLMKCSELPLRFVTRQEVARVPIFGRSLRAMGHVFVARGDGEAARRGMAEAARAIAAGRSVLVFPEGTRTETGALGPFKAGGFRLAAEARVPIVPIGIAGTRDILPKHGGWQRAGSVALVVGEAVDTRGTDLHDVTPLVARVRAEIERLRARAAMLAG